MGQSMRCFPTSRLSVKSFWILALSVAVGISYSTSAFSAAPGKAPSPKTTGVTQHDNALFNYTHLLPSPYTMKAGQLVIGSDAAFGLTDFLQIGTHVLQDFYKVFNVNAKVSLVDFHEFALGLTFGWETYNYQDISPLNPNIQVTSLLPGVVTAFGLLDDLAIFGGLNLNYTNTQLATSGIETSGYVTGARVESDISWAYNPKQKGVGNVLSSGVTYDLTYQILGLGISHHWPGFHFGIHYYPNASQYKVQPILMGGATMEL